MARGWGPHRVPRRKLGSQGLEVSALGLRCMGLSMMYGKPVDDKEGIAVIHYALPRDKVQLATKFGCGLVDGKLEFRGDAEYVRKSCEDSLERLGVDYIDLYSQHRVDPKVPIEITVGVMKKLVDEGKVKYIGLLEANAATSRRAHAVHSISALQIEWSLWTRDIEEEIIPVCRELGIGIVPFCPFGRGFVSGKAVVETVGDRCQANSVSKVSRENLEKNKVLYERVAAVAKRYKCTTGQLTLAWVLHQGDDVVPIPGTTKIPNLDENIGAVFVKLNPEEMEVAAAVPEHEVTGMRQGDDLFKHSWCQVITPR